MAFETRPWGGYEVWGEGPGWLCKRIEVAPGARLSLQTHRWRDERWVVAEGAATLTLGEETRDLAPGDVVEIPAGRAHRVANPGEAPLVLIEVQLGEPLSEDDIERHEDDYGRAG